MTEKKPARQAGSLFGSYFDGLSQLAEQIENTYSILGPLGGIIEAQRDMARGLNASLPAQLLRGSPVLRTRLVDPSAFAAFNQAALPIARWSGLTEGLNAIATRQQQISEAFRLPALTVSLNASHLNRVLGAGECETGMKRAKAGKREKA